MEHRIYRQKIILIKFFLKGALYDCLKLIYMYLNEGYKVRKCYSCLKMTIQAYLHIGFFTIFFIERISLNRFYLYMKLLQSSTVFKQKIIIRCLAIKIFAWGLLQLPVTTLYMVTIQKSKLTFLLLLYFHARTHFCQFCCDLIR